MSITAQWPFDDNLATSVVLDSIGSANGQLRDGGGGDPNNTSNQSTTDAVFVRAFDFVKADADIVNVASHASITFTDACTLGIWFKTAKIDKDVGNYLARGWDNVGAEVLRVRLYGKSADSTERIECWVKCVLNGVPGAFAQAISSWVAEGTWTNGEWHYVVFRFDKTWPAASRARLNIDYDAETAVGAGNGNSATVNNTGHLTFGLAYDGTLDNAGFWNDEAIPPEEIEGFWNEGNLPPKARVWGSGRLAAGTGRLTPGASRIR